MLEQYEKALTEISAVAVNLTSTQKIDVAMRLIKLAPVEVLPHLQREFIEFIKDKFKVALTPWEEVKC